MINKIRRNKLRYAETIKFSEKIGLYHDRYVSAISKSFFDDDGCFYFAIRNPVFNKGNALIITIIYLDINENLDLKEGIEYFVEHKVELDDSNKGTRLDKQIKVKYMYGSKIVWKIRFELEKVDDVEIFVCL